MSNDLHLWDTMPWLSHMGDPQNKWRLTHQILKRVQCLGITCPLASELAMKKLFGEGIIYDTCYRLGGWVRN